MADGARRFGHVERDEVGVLEQRVEVGDRAGQPERQLLDDVVEEHAHAEGLGEQADLLADVAVADDAEGAAAHFVRAGQRLVPRAGAARCSCRPAAAPGR